MCTRIITHKKDMLVPISSLKLSIVPCAAGPESRGHSWTAFVNISMSSCFPSFIVRWILNFVDQPTHQNHENWYPTNKSDFTVYMLNIKCFQYFPNKEINTRVKRVVCK